MKESQGIIRLIIPTPKLLPGQDHKGFQGIRSVWDRAVVIRTSFWGNCLKMQIHELELDITLNPKPLKNHTGNSKVRTRCWRMELRSYSTKPARKKGGIYSSVLLVLRKCLRGCMK